MTTLKNIRPEIAEKWATALESGQYPQGFGKNRTSTGYCCLGVLCELAKDEGIITYYNPDGYGPPEAVVRWAMTELTADTNSRYRDNAEYRPGDPDGSVGETVFTVGEGHETKYLTGYNDNDRLPFHKIAAIIRREAGL